MYNHLVDFWYQILAVFLPSYSYPVYFFFNHDYGTGVTTSSWSVNISLVEIASLLSSLSLIGLSVFLFYQVYKVIHAFVGGFYE